MSVHTVLITSSKRMTSLVIWSESIEIQIHIITSIVIGLMTVMVQMVSKSEKVHHLMLIHSISPYRRDGGRLEIGTSSSRRGKWKETKRSYHVNASMWPFKNSMWYYHVKAKPSFISQWNKIQANNRSKEECAQQFPIYSNRAPVVISLSRGSKKLSIHNTTHPRNSQQKP